jgi:hypothetical protein
MYPKLLKSINFNIIQVFSTAQLLKFFFSKKREEMDDTISLMDINKKHSVSMVTWNTDDTMVVTAQNNYLIKVWNSNDAKLIHELKVKFIKYYNSFLFLINIINN